MTVGEQEEAVRACEIALERYEENAVIVRYGCDTETDHVSADAVDEMLKQVAKVRGIKGVRVQQVEALTLPELDISDDNGKAVYAEVAMEKPEWKVYIKEKVKEITGYKPEAVYVEGDMFAAYPIVRALRK